ncbi:MAG TPA: hypothetical protein VD788_07495 [Candidatus Polarisedimenticolaceae bacterium]|nr:hypothetical protein [Candidatus Polarisedimenticolaceae bacterium]
MRSIRWLLILLVLVTVDGASRPARAGVDVDFGARVSLGDRADLYLSISSHYFDRDRQTVDHWHGRFHDPDDLAVALFISHHTGQSLDVLWALYQRRGLSWWEISLRYGMPVDLWFVEVERAPGPPYGKAYGHWKKHRADDRRVTFSDADLRNLVAVRMAHEYYGVPVELAMEWRAGGKDVRQLMCDEYERRHGARHAGPSVANGPSADKPGRGHGKGGKHK